jgi:hypothetical protein
VAKIWTLMLASAATLASLALAAQANAQTSAQTSDARPGDEKINQLIIYGNDACPQSKDDEITVCARLKETERYRIPTPLRDDPNELSKQAWTRRVEAYEYVGASGTLSCSPTGAGGFTGCGFKAIDTAYAEKKQDPAVTFGRLIAAERAKRLSGIDAEAVLVEERVIQMEKDSAELRAKREAAEEAAASAAELPSPPK